MSRPAAGLRQPSRAWLQLRGLLLPVVAYWGAVLLALGLFSAVILLLEGGFDQENILALGGIWTATVLGIGLGQGLALLRVRSWVVIGFASVFWVAMVILTVQVIEIFGEFALFMGMLWLLFPFFLVAGLWSLRVHMGLLATWAPLVFLTGCIIVISEETGKVGAWFAGDKWAIWDVFTAPILLLGVMLLLVYLASREFHRLHLWRYGPLGPDLPWASKERRAKAASMLPGCGGLIAVAALGVVLTVGAAIVAPYLWRTGPGDRPDDDPPPPHSKHENDPRQDRAEQPPPPPPSQDEQESSGCKKKQDKQEGDGDKDGEGAEGDQSPAEQVVEATKQAGLSLLMLMMLLVLAVLALVLFGPPFRRTLLLHHLRRPLWPVPPTRRVQQYWRLAEISLADAGVHRRAGETASAVATRAIRTLPELDPDAVLECAAIVDRVLYGLGLSPDDTDRAGRTAETTYQAIWDELSELDKIKAVYRFL